MDLFQAVESDSEIASRLGRGKSPNLYAQVTCGEVTPLQLAVYRRLPKAAEKLLDPTEVEFLVEIGWLRQAGEVLSQLIDLHPRADSAVDIVASKARFSLLCKRPQTARNARLPKARQAPDALPPSNPSNFARPYRGRTARVARRMVG